ncbi:MAG: XRE family transcriptional regulator [Sulfobacillus thermosulfidooxidans]|uniref:XRE family transcriptional regulator n=1 Tax=Sulfobacillus thermosulfidooxidans TaxID=28034 RepID=A0A2T2WPX5_SULTH|nr:helix-turn-helix transcriptional regulator [Sulfobacillus thermosulfidooxidans]PSR24273.1 MAG: XRE family transcriptional regulator [Sulfobacillus thermosulfidooxidans]
MQFGKFLREQRQAKHLSLVALAERTATSSSYLSRIERGLRNPPSPAVLRRLAQALDIPYEQLMERAGYLNTTLHEEPVFYGGINHQQWQEAVSTLSDEDWTDVWALIQNKVARRKQGHSS